MSTGTAAARSLEVVAHHDLGGRGDGMQVIRHGDVVYVGHYGVSGAGTSILGVRNPAAPELLNQWDAPPFSHTHKVQVADGLLLVNHESFPAGRPPRGPHSAGMAVYDLADPAKPRQVGFWESTGRGVHRIVWEGGRYAHMSATPAGFDDRIWVVVDLADPTEPVQVAAWWWPGQREGERRDRPNQERFAAHHALVSGEYAYLGYDDGNLVVLDVRDWRQPRQAGALRWAGAATHTCLPLSSRGLLVVTDEQTVDGPDAPERHIRVVDIAEPTRPQPVSLFPDPGPEFRARPLRSGPHNLHENRVGSYRSDRLIFSTWFNAGLRVHDLSDPSAPREVAHWVPEPPRGQAAPQTNDLFVDRTGLIWVTDRFAGGLVVLRPDEELLDLMRTAALEGVGDLGTSPM